MARTNITPVALSGANVQALDAIVWTAADPTNKNAVTLTGQEVLLIRNDDASAQDVTITSFPDSFGRTGDITESIPAGEYRAYGVTQLLGWKQDDGALYFEAASASVFFAVLRV